jgi:hypothetical protein
MPDAKHQHLLATSLPLWNSNEASLCRRFASVRTRNYEPALDLSMYDGIQLRVKGNGLRYKFILRSSSNWDTTGYTLSFDTTAGDWQTVFMPFSAFQGGGLGGGQAKLIWS